MKMNTLSLILISLLTGVTFLQPTQAVSPPPDGGYGFGNTAEGDAALQSLTPGRNTCCNTAIGDGALRNNNASDNTAVGTEALGKNTTGRFNTAIAGFSLPNNTTGTGNTATGYKALLSNTIGDSNTANGVFALTDNTGSNNTAIGALALQLNTTGKNNTASGFEALRSNTTGGLNTATGDDALGRNTTGFGNVAMGVNALLSNTTGDDNVAIGVQALHLSRTASWNTAVGEEALAFNTTGERNTAIGFNSLDKNTTGSFNVAIGAGAGSGVDTADDVICIGRAVSGANVNGTCFIGNIRGVQTQNANALPVVIDGAGQLGIVASSERFKKDIAIMGQASEGILSLRPVTFHYKKDTTGTPQFGLIAEEVAKVNPALVLPDKEGKPYTVRYDAVNAMLLNEFLKEHRKNEQQEATIARQQKQIDTLAAAVQKVSAQLEVSKTAPQTVLNNR